MSKESEEAYMAGEENQWRVDKEKFKDLNRELTAYQITRDNGLLRGVRILFAKQGLTDSEALTMLAIESCSSNPWWQIYP